MSTNQLLTSRFMISLIRNHTPCNDYSIEELVNGDNLASQFEIKVYLITWSIGVLAVAQLPYSWDAAFLSLPICRFTFLQI
jgi:hypothetical protein